MPAETLLQDDYVVAPLRRHALPPITDGAAAVVLAAGDRATEWSERPVWITGIDHRMETHSLGARDLTISPSVAKAAEMAGVSAGKVDIAELHVPYAHQELIVKRGAGPRRLGGRQPVGRAPGRQPADVGRPHPHRRGGQPHPGR